MVAINWCKVEICLITIRLCTHNIYVHFIHIQYVYCLFYGNLKHCTSWVLMKTSSIMRLAITKNKTGDLIGIVLALIIGFSGLMISLNPLEVLAPGIPMLSSQDWEGSRTTSRLRDSSSSNLKQWNKKRVFDIRLEVGRYYGTNAEIWQGTVWYAESTEALSAWTRRDSRQSDFFNNAPIASTSLDKDNPASVLYCDERRKIGFICGYFAYWENWYTEVWFWSHGDEYLSFSEMQQIIIRVNQLLISAPDKP
jgi:hypothetical protein